MPKPALAAQFGLADDFALLGSFIADNEGLKRFAGTAPLNTDDRPWVAYRAPRITYAPDSAARDRLMALLTELTVDTTALLTTPELAPRLNAYAQARRDYLELGRRTEPSADPATMLTRVGTPLLAVLSLSPDFQPAAEPLRRLTAALAERDPVAAQAWMAALQQVRPTDAP